MSTDVNEYAVIKTGGKQYRVSSGTQVKVERLDAEVGAEVSFDSVLMIGGGGSDARVGAPLLDGASVKAEVVEHGRGAKIRIIKFKRRQDYRRTAGHRQHYTHVRVTAING